MKIFGYELTKPVNLASEKSMVPPTDDGAIDTVMQNHYGMVMDLDGSAKTESELIRQYRVTSEMADVDMAVEDIVNESIANIDNDPPVTLFLEKVKLSEPIKKKIEDEFRSILKMLNFDMRSHDLFRRWYVDGRIFFHKVIDVNAPKDGIKDIRYIDPRKIKKVREIFKEKDEKTGNEFVKAIKEYFVYNQQGLNNSPGVGVAVASRVQGIRITKDAIAYAPSGLFDSNNNMVLSYIHKAMKPANQLRMMENAVIIYRLARAPERRIFYIDVGNLPKNKAEQYIKSIADQYRNKISYDASTGTQVSDKKFMSVLDDFWLARREGGKGTQIETLPGAQSSSVMEEVTYYQHKLYESLRVPISRLEQQGGLNFGRASEITRDELKFVKFIDKLQKQFSVLFQDLLRTQLLLKEIMTEEDWKKIDGDIQYIFAQDAYYAESKKQEILRARFELLGTVAQYQGQYLSRDYIMKNILNLTKEEIEIMDKEIQGDPANPLAMSPSGGGIPIDTETGDPLGMKQDNRGPNGKPAKKKVTAPKAPAAPKKKLDNE